MTPFDVRYPECFADLPGVRLSYRDSGGAGPVMVFLHANTGTTESWGPQFDHFAARGWRVIGLDRRGLGGSRPQPDTGPQPGSLSGDLDGLVARLGLNRFVLVAVAGGGFHALDYAAWRPERVRALVVAASNGRVSETVVQEAIAALKMPWLTDDNHQYLEIGPGYRMTNPEGVRAWLEIEHKARCQGGGGLQPLRTPNTFAKLATIAAPALIVSGCADMLSPPPLMRLWADHVPDHAFVTIEGAGHALPWECPDRFNALVERFLDERLSGVESLAGRT